MNKSSFEEELLRKDFIVYTNKGDSMMPLIKEGRDLLIIKRPKEWDTGVRKLKRLDIPLYKRDTGAYVLHRVLKVRKDDYVICGDNRYGREYGIEDRHVIGVLTAVVRNGKEIPVNSGRLRIYAHIWCDLFYIRAFILRIKSLPKRIKRKFR